jgi:hypothetical protein
MKNVVVDIFVRGIDTNNEKTFLKLPPETIDFHFDDLSSTVDGKIMRRPALP